MTAANRKVMVDSAFGSGEVEIDPWAVNALADDLAAGNPWVTQLALKEGPAPRMFSGGTADLPSFTASGIDPQLLLQLPARVRHFAAALSDRAQVGQLFEDSSTDPYASLDHPGLQAAIDRLRTWAKGKPFDNLQQLRDQLDQREQFALRQQAVNDAFERGGDAASKALIAQYQAQDQARQADEDRNYAASMDAMAASGLRPPGSGR